MKIKKAISIVLAMVMVLSLVACNKPSSTSAPNGTPTPAPSAGPRTADIKIGTWWVQHYDSNDDELSDSPDWATCQDKEGDDDAKKAENAINRAVSEAKFAVVKKIEQKYGVKFYWDNITYEGVRESINTSILAGTPDEDIYLCDSQMAIPGQMNNLFVDLKTILPADHDIFTTQKVATYLDLGDGKACILRRVGGMDNNGALAYNKQLLEAEGLEDPVELWEKGQWTWDKFLEYAKKLTKDTDGDGQIDQYGLGGYFPDIFEKIMLSNGANICAGTTQQLTSSKMTEVLNFIQKLYLEEKVCEPINKDDDANKARTSYRNNNVGFFYIDPWIQQTDGSDYDWDGTLGYTLDWDVAYGFWPVGPSGNQDLDPRLNNTGGELYVIPSGVQDPLTVFNVLYDMWNWYEGDTSKRDDIALQHWWAEVTGNKDSMAADGKTPLRQKNFQVQCDILSKQTVDLWNSLNVSFDLWSLVDNTEAGVTAAQWQTTYAPAFQDALDQTYGN